MAQIFHHGNKFFFIYLLYLFVSDEPDTSRTKSEITSEISATDGGGNVDEAANDE